MTVESSAKRPRIQPEDVPVQEDVGVVEVTVEAEEASQQNEPVQVPDVEEEVEVEEEHTQTSKKVPDGYDRT